MPFGDSLFVLCQAHIQIFGPRSHFPDRSGGPHRRSPPVTTRVRRSSKTNESCIVIVFVRRRGRLLPFYERLEFKRLAEEIRQPDLFL